MSDLETGKIACPRTIINQPQLLCLYSTSGSLLETELIKNDYTK